MKILIVYSSVWGVSKQCAQMLADMLCDKHEVSVFSIENAPSPAGFDVAVVGGSVRMGRLNRQLRSYLKNNAEALSGMNTALFMCCGLSENFDDYVALQFPTSVIPSLGIHYFGGELKPEKLKGFDRIAVKMMRSSILGNDFEAPDPSVSPLPEILPETISRLAESIRKISQL